MKIFFLLSALIFFTVVTSKATHVTGGELSYQCTSTPGVFLVTFRAYRDCSGAPLCSCSSGPSPSCNIMLNISGAASPCNGTSYGTTSLNILTTTPVRDVVQLCNLATTVCNNCATRTAGSFAPGIELYVFQGLVNLTSLPSNCCSIRLSYSICCRNGNITTIINPSGSNFYTDVTLNRCITPCNNSAVVNNNHPTVFCTGSQVTYSPAITDPEGDSLVISFGSVLSALNTPVQYQSPFSPSAPFPYFGLPSPQLIQLNRNTGELTFTPIGTFNSVLAMDITEFRNILGTPTPIGTKRYEVGIYAQNCPANAAPKFRTYNNVNTATGTQPLFDFVAVANNQLCFTVAGQDSTQGHDTTDLSWHIPAELDTTGFTITRLFNNNTRNLNGPRRDSIRICWTPGVNRVRAKPYYFTLMLKDRACPVPANISKTFSITVNAAVPVKLNTFNAKLINDKIELYWQTAQEINNKGFYIEQSFDGINFSNIGFVKGIGNTINTSNYNFLHQIYKTNTKPNTFFYRLRQVDFDGKHEYSDVISINITSLDEINLFPNPANNNISLTLNVPLQDEAVLSIYNVEGKLLKTYKLQPNNLIHQFNISELSNGFYFVKVEAKQVVKNFNLIKE